MEVAPQPDRSETILISDGAHVSQARRRLGHVLAQLHIKGTQAGAAEIVLTEAAKNILKHARTGQIVLRRIDCDHHVGVEILAIDRGPGMMNPAKCMEDGYSTAGSPGTGMGAMRRLSHVFDFFTQPGKGTVVLAQVQGKHGTATGAHPTVAAVCLPKMAGDFCGDGWAVRKFGAKLQILVVDGLGHGIFAGKAADEALRVFREDPPSEASATIEKMHLVLRSTRGASLAIAEISPAEGLVRFTGVGNIAGVVAANGGTTKSMVSHSGTVGYEIHRLRGFEYPWAEGCHLIMHSDGIGTRWDVSAYPGLLTKHPSVIAGVLFRDWQRGNDDVSVVVVRTT